MDRLPGINNKTNCYGCRACESVCPKGCISMTQDKDGFYYPDTDPAKCIGCHLCEKVCPAFYEDFSAGFEQKAYAGIHKSESICFNSSSGGAFTALYEEAVKDGFIVYGVKWGEDFRVLHDCAYTVEECRQFRKSKYIISDLNGSYVKIEKQLKEGKKVLFSGTPCQCAALKKYLDVKRIDVANLLIVDIVCHGAPSQKVFDEYIKELAQKNNPGIYVFRNKIPYRNQVNTRTAQIVFENGQSKIIDSESDPFLRGYYGRLFYRPSCGVCKFARMERPSDITIADAWHIEEIFPKWDSQTGVSLILVNSTIGEKWVNRSLKMMDVIEVENKWARYANAQLNSPTQMHRGRTTFFANLANLGFSRSVKKAMYIPLWKRIIRKGKLCLNSIYQCIKNS